MPEEALGLAKIAELDRFIGGSGRVVAQDGRRGGEFVLVADAPSARMARDPKAPPYRGKPGREKDSGSQCFPYPRHMLLLCLERVRRAAVGHGGAHGVS